MTEEEAKVCIGDIVTVSANDYTYQGWLVAVFPKRSGQIRVVVEDGYGRLFIHNLTQVHS